jgi:hypothetical protein
MLPKIAIYQSAYKLIAAYQDSSIAINTEITKHKSTTIAKPTPNRTHLLKERLALSDKPSYLEPVSQSLHVPIEGVYRKAEKIEDRSRIS